ncbi:Transposon Ty3-G Gag-Pol poly [Paramuricea clavata]|uniref:Transposon Ty3-G Gag-Pol poly n=1 Tax=Paramuricea clavata TaxID=317549 RepID=A0A6S7K792_PARCT|nr:Transposon Ty3-G Gag-Pol poly [Paramuricea clavata]
MIKWNNSWATASADTRPRVSVRLLDKNIEALYDPGSQITALRESEFDNLVANSNFSPIPAATTPVALKAADSSHFSAKIFMLPFEYNSKKCLFPTYVAKELSSKLIIGDNFIKYFNIAYNPKPKTDHIGIIAKNSDSFTLDANEQKRVIVQVSLDTSVTLPKTVVIDQLPDAKYHVTAALYTINDHKCSLPVILANTTPLPFHFPPNSTIAAVTLLDQNQKLVPLTPDTAKSLCAVNIKQKRVTPEFINKLKQQFRAPHLSQQQQQELMSVIIANADVFSSDKYDLGRTQTHQHDIALKEQKIIFRKQFRIPQEHIPVLQEHTEKLLALGVIKHSNSKFNSPVFCVPKKDGSLRIVIDYRDLNRISQPDYYVTKTIDDCIDIIGKNKSTIFSSLDLTSGFHQMPLTQHAQEYTAFSVPEMGSFQWTTSPFGLFGCPASFSRLMDKVMSGLPHTLCYLDDTLIHSNTWPGHLLHLQQTFDRLRLHNLKLNMAKCSFAQQELNYLGFNLSKLGITPGYEKAKTIANASPPDSKKKILEFLGLANYFRRHVENFGVISQHLSNLTKKDSEWKGGPLPENALQAFNKLKQALSAAPVMAYPDPNLTFHLTVDAATGDQQKPGGLGAYLSQFHNGVEKVIAYASRGLKQHEKNYPPFLLEMQAAVYGIDHFYVYLTNRHFELHTDHKPLQKLSTQHTKTLNRLQEMMLTYDFNINYKQGSLNVVSDYCSRNVAAISHQTTQDATNFFDMDPKDMHILQMADPELNALFAYVNNREAPPPPFRNFVRHHAINTLLHDDLLFTTQKVRGETRFLLFLPTALQDDVIKMAHNSQLAGHNGIFKTVNCVNQNYYFSGLQAAVEKHIKACISCQKGRNFGKNPTAPIIPLPQENGPNQRVHVDLYGPLKSDSDAKYVLVMTDAFSKYVELAAIPNKEAKTVATAIFDKWICRHSVPITILSDGGREFCNNIFSELLTKLGTTHLTTTPRHPQCNAQVEQFNRTMTRYLRAFTDDNTLDWPNYLSALMFSYNTAIHKAIKTSPFRLLYNCAPRLPFFDADAPKTIFLPNTHAQEQLLQIQRAREIAQEENMSFRDAYTHFFNQNRPTPNFSIGQKVLLHAPNLVTRARNLKLANPWVGPFSITRVFDNHNLAIVNDANKKQTFRVHFDRVKPFHSKKQDSEVSQFSDPRTTPDSPPITNDQEYHFSPDNLSLLPPPPQSRLQPPTSTPLPQPSPPQSPPTTTSTHATTTTPTSTFQPDSHSTPQPSTSSSSKKPFTGQLQQVTRSLAKRLGISVKEESLPSRPKEYRSHRPIRPFTSPDHVHRPPRPFTNLSPPPRPQPTSPFSPTNSPRLRNIIAGRHAARQLSSPSHLIPPSPSSSSHDSTEHYVTGDDLSTYPEDDDGPPPPH